jgi:NAD(P)-dependent dehydrogenase (short-subunit alcohol dehydrogenase family)/acyl carrier protein
VIDIAPDTESAGARKGGASLVRQIVDELVTDVPGGLVAYRLGHRYTPVYEPLAVDTAEPSGVAIREGGVYLITGGFGSIGSVFARHLAGSRAKLALVSRFPLPSRDRWAEWLGTHDESDATSRRIRSVKALEGLGAEVMPVAADITNPDQMSAVVAQVAERFGTLHGVIQAAGVVDETAFAPVAEIRPRGCDNQFRPKMLGLAAMERALGDRPLDFCYVVSSLSSVLGGLRYAGYAGANIFMDAFVHRHNHLGGTPWVSVNWDAWTFEEPSDEPPTAGLTKFALTPAEATVAFDHLLRIGPVGQVIVSTANLYARIKEWIELNAARSSQPDDAAEPVRQLYARPAALEGTFEPPSTPFEETVAGVWQQVLGIERVGRKDNFFDLGGHSLLAVQVLAKLGRVYGIQVPLRLMFDALTVAELADGVQTLVWSSQGADHASGSPDAEVEELEI